MNLYLISDPHFGHESVINFGNRPFKDAAEMTEVLVERWNKKVGKRDTVICLGDWGWGSRYYGITDRLNGTIRLVMGNHDSGNMKHLVNRFASVHGSLFKKGLMLTHIPIMMDKYHLYDWVVHGHIHDKSMNVPDYRYININMDAWPYREGEEYSPIHIDDIHAECKARLLASRLEALNEGG